MKTPRQLKSDVRNNFLYKFLEKKKQNNNKFECKYEILPRTAVAGTKHTITTDTNKILHRKLISKPLPNSFRAHYHDKERMQGDRTYDSLNKQPSYQ